MIFIHLFLYLLFRKNPNRFRDDPVATKGVVFSPCNGKIYNIKHLDEEISIEFSIFPWNEMGIFMPISSEIKNLWRTRNEVILELDNRFEMIKIHFLKRLFGFWPELIVTPGDKGARQVNIGYFPLGGTLVLYLPKKYEILINNLSEVIAGETIIAVLPEKT
jgi:phosphatidylserine decarboxylase